MPLRHLQVGEPSVAATIRERELEVGRLVLRAAESTGASFLTRRAKNAVAELDSGPARRALRRVVEGLEAGAGASAAEATGTAAAETVHAGLLAYGAVLERHAVYDVAVDVYRHVMIAKPGDARVTLHAARAERRAGRRDEALALYRQAGRQAAGNRHLGLVARIGEALVSDQPIDALNGVLRDARRRGDRDAIGIAREERSRFMAASGRGGAAVRDLAAAAGRYTDRIDRVRVAHRMAELLSARGDLAGAREALLTAMDQVHTAQRGHTVQRLRTVARAMGDELELRRTRGQSAPAALVSLAPAGRRRTGASPRSVAPALRRWRTVLAPAAATDTRTDGTQATPANC